MSTWGRVALVTAAAVVGLVSLGAGSASATKYTVLCKQSEAPCKATNVEEEGAKFVASGSSVEFVGYPFGFAIPIVCEGSEWDESITLQKKGEPRLEGLVEWVKFPKCKTSGGTNCTVGALNTAWKLLFEYQPGGGWMTILPRASGVPGVSVECGMLTNCNYYVSEEDEEFPEESAAHLEVTNGASLAQFHATAVELQGLSGPNCNSIKKLFFYATYVLSKPEPLWVSYVE